MTLEVHSRPTNMDFRAAIVTDTTKANMRDGKMTLEISTSGPWRRLLTDTDRGWDRSSIFRMAIEMGTAAAFVWDTKRRIADGGIATTMMITVRIAYLD
jgi:hypothetical protein